MDGILAVEDRITEDQFEGNIRGADLTNVERESLRKYYGLPCNEILLSYYTRWEVYAYAAWQKIARVNPALLRCLSGC